MEKLMRIIMVVYLFITVAGCDSTMKEASMKSKEELDIKIISNMLENYKIENGIYPTTSQGLQALKLKPLTPPIPKSWRPYAKKIPVDRWGMSYIYRNPGIHNTVDVFSLGADGIESNDDIVSGINN